MSGTPLDVAAASSTGHERGAAAVTWAPRITAVAALVGIGAVHLYLYAHEDYHFIPTIGALFLFNTIFAGVLALAFAVRAHWTLALLGIGFSVGTFAGYAWALHGTLFKFHEQRVTTSGALSIAFEALSVIALASWVLLDRRHARPSQP